MKMCTLNYIQLSSSTLSSLSNEGNPEDVSNVFTSLKMCERFYVIKDYIYTSLRHCINPALGTNSEKNYKHMKQNFLKQKNNRFEMKVAKKTFNLDEKKRATSEHIQSVYTTLLQKVHLSKSRHEYTLKHCKDVLLDKEMYCKGNNELKIIEARKILDLDERQNINRDVVEKAYQLKLEQLLSVERFCKETLRRFKSILTHEATCPSCSSKLNAVGCNRNR